MNLGVLPKLRSLFLAHNRLSEIQELGTYYPSLLAIPSDCLLVCLHVASRAHCADVRAIADNLFVDRCPSLIEISLK